MMTTPAQQGPLSGLGRFLKRTALFFWGPSQLAEDVDPIVAMDRESGIEPRPVDEPHPSERQHAYDRLPRGHE